MERLLELDCARSGSRVDKSSSSACWLAPALLLACGCCSDMELDEDVDALEHLEEELAIAEQPSTISWNKETTRHEQS